MINRRQMLGYGPALGAAGIALPLVAAVTGGADADTTPAVRVPTLQFVYECNVTIAAAQDFGPTVEGRRRVIPITGGSFEGLRMRGQVVSEGADWNLSRNDGAGSVDADYYLRTDDDVTIRVVNKGVGVGGPPKPGSPEVFLMFTNPVFEAPQGKYDWLNKSMFVGTLSVRPSVKSAVLIRVFQPTW